MTREDKESIPHRYPLPETGGAQSSWSGLSGPAREALADDAVGPSDASRLLGNEEAGEAPVLSKEAKKWAKDEIKAAIESWKNYSDELTTPVPATFNEFISMNPNAVEFLSYLFEAQQTFMTSSKVTPDGKKLGKAMHLILIPWGNLQQVAGQGEDGGLEAWLEKMRAAQGVTRGDTISGGIWRAIDEEQPFYRDPSDPAEALTPRDYLDERVRQNGPWGVMLAQTTNLAGLRALDGDSADSLTDDGKKHLQIKGYNVDAMGVFEWLSLSLQGDPTRISMGDTSLLFANRFASETGPRVWVPAGNFEPGVGVVNLENQIAHDGKREVQPRLAVMETPSN